MFVINLLRYLKEGKELTLTKEFVRQIFESGDLAEDIKYLNFDFHGYCGGDKYYNLKVLASKIQSQILEYGWFECSSNSKNATMKQQGVFRTNCLDSLDRTNVVQGVIGLISLQI